LTFVDARDADTRAAQTFRADCVLADPCNGRPPWRSRPPDGLRADARHDRTIVRHSQCARARAENGADDRAVGGAVWERSPVTSSRLSYNLLRRNHHGARPIKILRIIHFPPVQFGAASPDPITISAAAVWLSRV